MSLSEQRITSQHLIHDLILCDCCVWQTWTSVQSRAPAVSRTAPTTPGVTSVTAQRDTDSTQTDVAVMVCLTPSQKVWMALTLKRSAIMQNPLFHDFYT